MNQSVIAHCKGYVAQLVRVLEQQEWNEVETLAQTIFRSWEKGQNLFLCGNGGSAGNAIHLANDFLYGVGKDLVPGIKVEALSANASVLTCLANDIGYEEIYSVQIETKGRKGDVLLVLSGSGNSPNIVRALEAGKKIGMRTFAILGYTGGRCKDLADVPIHFTINDMQISEDLQLIVGHMCMQWLSLGNANN